MDNANVYNPRRVGNKTEYNLMKEVKVSITKDEIRVQDDSISKNNGIVMDKVAKRLTGVYCKIVGESKGSILDVGFGLGYSANYFYKMGVESYTCIELNDTIYETALEWAKDKPNVKIVKGDWIDIIPTLTQKFDGIFMDTYGDELDKYATFEKFVENIAAEGCILSLWEYPKVRNISELNIRKEFVEPGDYELLLDPIHRIGWTYFFNGRFRKENLYRKYNRIPKSLCKKIIEENEGEGFVEDKRTAMVNGIPHTRNVSLKDLKYNRELYEIIQKTLFPQYRVFDEGSLYFSKLIKYHEGGLHSRHVETQQGLSLIDPDQYHESIIINLNDDYEGGELRVYDVWHKSDWKDYSTVKNTAGDIINFKPFQHSETVEISKGTKYEIFIKVKIKEFKRLPKTII